MNESELKQTILGVLSSAVPGIDTSILGGDDDIRATLDIDSFDHLNFLVGLHEKLGVDIPEKDYGKLNTVNEILQYLIAHKVVSA
jgi:acyl carrier protein